MSCFHLRDESNNFSFHNPKSERKLRRRSERCVLCQYGLWSFQAGGTKLRSFLPKNQRNQRLMGRCQKLGIILENKVI